MFIVHIPNNKKLLDVFKTENLSLSEKELIWYGNNVIVFGYYNAYKNRLLKL